MFEYNTWRTLNGAGSLVAAGIILVIGVLLLRRGYAERSYWVKQVPGRIVIGSFLTLHALIDLGAALAKVLLRSVGLGGVGRYINSWYVVTAIVVSIVLGLWSVWRLMKNTLGERSGNE